MNHKLSENEFYSPHLWEMQQNEYNDIVEKQSKINHDKIKEAINSAVSANNSIYNFSCLVCMNLVYDPFICQECENTMVCKDCCNPINCIGHSFVPKEIKGVLKRLLYEHQIIYT